VGAAPVTIAWSPVGNAGNAADPATGFGAVNSAYNIGTYDVTNDQYVAFLNSNVPGGETADPLALYNSKMSDATFGGINYDPAAASGNKYSVISARGDNPVNFVSFYDTLRFANWLNNGQTPGSTETGAYTLLGGTPKPSNSSNIVRNTGATVFLPSDNEWYKAAYYSPATGSYFLYPTSSNTVPAATGPTSTPNSANYDGAVGSLTAVGAYTGTTSPYGAFDMGGNVSQWNEALIDGLLPGVRAGSFNGLSDGLLSSTGASTLPAFEFSNIGFRVASVPEPGTAVLAVMAFGLMRMLRKRFK
jgi:formylglycine-generating enzyme